MNTFSNCCGAPQSDLFPGRCPRCKEGATFETEPYIESANTVSMLARGMRWEDLPILRRAIERAQHNGTHYHYTPPDSSSHCGIHELRDPGAPRAVYIYTNGQGVQMMRGGSPLNTI